MAIANFYLKDPKAKKPSLVYLFFSFDNKRLKYSTGEKVLPKSWNPEKQRARLTFTGADSINDLLGTIDETAMEIYRNGKTKKEKLSTDIIRERLNKALDKNQVADKTLYQYFDDYLEIKTAKIAPTTKRKLLTLQSMLKEFNPKLSFEKIGMGFYEDFINHLLTVKQHRNPTIDKYIGALKSFLHWSVARGYNTNHESIKFSLAAYGLKYEPSPIPLTGEELLKLAEHDFSKNLRLERVRDIYCFACYTSLRISDFKRVERANIKKNMIVIHAQKTKSQLEIPLIAQSRAILEKYNYKFPVISEQRFNDYIKEACKEAGICDEWMATYYRGNKTIQKKAPKYEFITAHTGRDTFITIHLSKGTPPYVVMSYTGHKDPEMLKPYLKLVDTVKDNYMQIAFEGKNNFAKPKLNIA